MREEERKALKIKFKLNLQHKFLLLKKTQNIWP